MESVEHFFPKGLWELWEQNFCGWFRPLDPQKEHLRIVFKMALGTALKKPSSVCWSTEQGQAFSKIFGMLVVWRADVKQDLFVAVQHWFHKFSVTISEKKPTIVKTKNIFKNKECINTGDLVVFAICSKTNWDVVQSDQQGSLTQNGYKIHKNYDLKWVIRDLPLTNAFGRDRDPSEIECGSSRLANGLASGTTRVDICRLVFLADDFCKEFCNFVERTRHLKEFAENMASRMEDNSHGYLERDECRLLQILGSFELSKPPLTKDLEKATQERIVFRPYGDQTGKTAGYAACYKLEMQFGREIRNTLHISPVGVRFLGCLLHTETSDSCSSGGKGESHYVSQIDNLRQPPSEALVNTPEILAFGSFGSTLRGAKVSAMLFELASFLQAGTSLTVAALTKYDRLHASDTPGGIAGEEVKSKMKWISEIEIKRSATNVAIGARCRCEMGVFRAFECSLEEALDFVKEGVPVFSFFQGGREGLRIVHDGPISQDSALVTKYDKFWDCFGSALKCLDGLVSGEDTFSRGATNLREQPSKLSLSAYRNCTMKSDPSFLCDEEMLRKRVRMMHNLTARRERDQPPEKCNNCDSFLDLPEFVATSLYALCKRTTDLAEAPADADVQFELFEDSAFLNFPTFAERYASKFETSTVRANNLDHSRYGTVGILDNAWQVRYFPSNRLHRPKVRKHLEEARDRVILSDCTFDATKARIAGAWPNRKILKSASVNFAKIEAWKWLARAVSITEAYIRYRDNSQNPRLFSFSELYATAEKQVLLGIELVTRVYFQPFCFRSFVNCEEPSKRQTMEMKSVMYGALNGPEYSHPSVAMEVFFEIFSARQQGDKKDAGFECRWSHGENTPTSLLGIVQRSLLLRDIRVSRMLVFVCIDAKCGLSPSGDEFLLPCSYAAYVVLLGYEGSSRESCIISSAYPSRLSIIEIYNSATEVQSGDLLKSFKNPRVLPVDHLDRFIFPHVQSCIWFEF